MTLNSWGKLWFYILVSLELPKNSSFKGETGLIINLIDNKKNSEQNENKTNKISDFNIEKGIF